MEIDGVTLINSEKVTDDRGFFRKVFSDENQAISFNLREVFFSVSEPGVFRGMHLQTSNSESSRVVALIEGEIIDVLIDLRKTSKTYMNVKEISWLAGDALGAIFIPPGVAHGFYARQKSTLVYFSDNNHVPALDSGVNIRSLSVTFKDDIKRISKRDESLPSLNEWIHGLK